MSSGVTGGKSASPTVGKSGSFFPSPTPWGWFILDFAAGVLVCLMAFGLTPYTGEAVQLSARHVEPIPTALAFGLVLSVLAHALEMHKRGATRRVLPVALKLMTASTVSLALVAVLVFTVLYLRIGRYITALIAIMTPVIMVAVRLVIWNLSSQNKERVLLAGAGRMGRSVPGCLAAQHMQELEIVGYVDSNRELAGTTVEGLLVRHLGSSLAEICQSLRVHRVVVCFSGRPTQEVQNSFMECIQRGVQVTLFADFIERASQMVPVEFIDGFWFLNADITVHHPAYAFVKRQMDIAVSLVGMLASLPAIALSAVMIKLESPGPVFYSQERVGRFGKVFRIYKLRSMRADAEVKGAQWASKGDPRVTRVGRVLRLTRLDELPQFWNVLTGDMSLVGPRPERPEFTRQLAAEIPYFEQRLVVKPGLTGWAQISYPYGASVEDARNKLKYDLFYIKNLSPLLDLEIIMRTMGVMARGSR